MTTDTESPAGDVALVDYPYRDAHAFHREVADRIIEVWQRRETRLSAGKQTARPRLLTVAEMASRIGRVYAGVAGPSVGPLVEPTALWVVAVGDLGGVARHVLDATRVGVPGWRVVVLCPEGPLAERLREQGSAVVTAAISPEDPVPGGVTAVRQTIRSLRPAVAHSHLAYSDFLVAAASIGLASKLVTTEHGIAGDDLVYHGSRWRSRTMEIAHAVRLRRFDALIAVADATLQAVRRKWRPQRGLRTIVIPNGVNVPATLPEHAPGRFHIVSLSRLAPEKNLADLLDAFSLVSDAHPKARLTLAGDGPLRGELARRVEELELGAVVTMPGHLEAKTLLTEADVLVQLSTWENCSYSLLDAVAHGLSVVATNVGGNVDVAADFNKVIGQSTGTVAIRPPRTN